MNKKIFVLFFALFFLLPNIKAETFFNVLPSKKSILINNIEERYRWYKEVEEEYYKEEYSEGCEGVSGDFSEWSLEKPEEKENRIIEKRTEEIDLSSREYNRIILSGFIVEYLELKEIELTNDAGIKIPHTIISCNNCGKTVTGDMLLNKNSSVELKLDKLYSDILQVEIRFGKDNNILFWETTLYKDSYPVRYTGTRTVGALSKVCASTYCLYKLHYMLPWNEYPSYKNIYYRYKDDYFKCYEYKKEYIDGYYKELDGYIKDESTRVYYYQYEEVKSGLCKSSFDKKNEVNEVFEKNNITEESDDMIAINYGTKDIKKEYSKIPLFIIGIISILTSLVIICFKMRKNILENEK